MLALAVLCLGALVGFAPSAEAQTSHFSGAVISLGSGFNQPSGVAMDASGNLFVADSSSNAVKEILAVNGIIPANPTVRILGGGFQQPSGVAVDGSGNVFVADSANGRVVEIIAVGGSIPASAPNILTLGSGFIDPYGVAVDASGNVFVADYGNGAVNGGVKEITIASGYLTVNTLASANGNFSHPSGVALDSSGNVFVADQSNSAIKEITVADGYITVNTLASANGNFHFPTGVAVDGSGNVFVADSINNAVKEILAVDGYTTVNTLGSGFNQPGGVVVAASGNIFVADYGNGAVKEIMTQGVNFGSAAIATTTPLTIPLTFTLDAAGTIGGTAVLTQGAANLDFADAGSDTCTAGATFNAGDTCTLNVSFTPKFSGIRYGAATLSDSTGAVIATAYVYGTGLGPQVTFAPATQTSLGSGFSAPQAVAVDGSGNVFVADYYNNAVKEILAVNGIIPANPTINTLGSGFNQPTSVAVDGSGNVFVADSQNLAVKEILAAGGYTTVKTLRSGFFYPNGVAVDGSGNVFVADYNAVKEILAPDGYTTVRTLSSGFTGAFGVAVDGSGNVFVAEYYNNAVKEILAAGGYTTVNTVGSGFSYPHGVAVDGNGNVFVADNQNTAVKEILAAGGYTTVKTLSSGSSSPSGVAVDGSGNVFVADSSYNAVRRMDFADPPSLSFASTAIGSTSSDSPQTVTLTNIGNAPLSISSIISDNAGFTQDAGSTTCSTSATVAAGNTCNVGVVFTPQVIGSVTGHLTITDNAPAPGSAQVTPLSGIAAPASFGIALVPATVMAGTSVQATVTALGASGNVLTGFSGTANLTFTPDASSSTFPATVTLTNGVGNFTFAPTTVTSSGGLLVSFGDVSSSANFVVAAAAATQIVISPATVSAVGSLPFSITAAEEDVYGNLVPATLSVAIAPGGGATASGPVSIASGTGAMFTPNGTAGQYTITFSNGSLSATTTVTASVADSFVVETLGDPNAGNYYGTASNCVNQTTASVYQTGATTNANCSLRDAVAAANGTSGASITFDPAVVSKANPGTIVLGEELEANSSIMITGPGSAALTLDGSHADTDGIWDFESDQASNVSGMTLLNPDYVAIYNDGGSIAINDVTVTYDGAPLDYTPWDVLELYGTATVSNSSFLNVPSVSSGVAVLLYDDGSVSNSQFRNISGTALVTGADARYGGGAIYPNSVSNSVFDSNNTSSSINNSGLAGGVLVSYSANLTVTGSTFSNNTAISGAGIDLELGNVVVSNSTFSGNASTDTGLGSTIFNNGTGALTILDSTLSGNTDAAGGEVAIANGGTVTVQNSIVAANNGSATSTGDCTGCTLVGRNVIDVDPKLQPLGSYGSATPQTPALQTMLPLPNSPAVCASAATTDTTDERGYPRTTVNGTSSCYDIGAVQTAYTLAFTQQPTDTLVLSAITPAPAVQLSEHGAYFPGVSVTIGASSGTLSGTTAQTTDSIGTASFSNLSFNTATSETLTASVGTLSATSNSFNATAITPTIAFSVPSHTYGDAPFTVSATSNSTGAFTYTVVSGPATIAGSTVTLTGVGMVVLQASEAADSNFSASIKNATFNVTTITPAITFTVPGHTYGDAPFTVSATSTSTGAFTYTVVSGPATVSGSTVTLTGAGTVVVSASQLASGNYAPATETTSFTVAAGFTLSSGSGTGSTSGTATVAPGAAATFTLTLSPEGAAIYPHALTLSATGLPPGATATFSPATILAGSAVTPVTLTIQTSSQTARNKKPSLGESFAPVALGFLLLPLAGMKSVRRRLRQMPRLTVALAIAVLSLGALLGLSGCGGKDAANQTAKSYTVAVIATDVTTGAHSSANVTLNVQ